MICHPNLLIMASRRRGDGHTILFLQPTDDESRTYTDFKSVEDTLFGLCEMFEETYKEKHGVEEVTYEIDEVIAYFANFEEMLVMVFDDEIGQYVPHDSDWIIEKLTEYGSQAMSEVDAQSIKGVNGMRQEIEENWEEEEMM